MAQSRAALRIGLIGGIVLSIAVAAQQITDSPDMQFLGYIIILGGLCLVGYLAARDVGNYERMPAMRAGAVGGLIAGLITSLAVVAVLLVLSVTGVNMQRIDAAIRELYTPDQLQQYASMGVTIDAIAQMTTMIQLLCCPAGLPIMGVLLGTLGGSFVHGIYGRRGGGSRNE